MTVNAKVCDSKLIIQSERVTNATNRFPERMIHFLWCYNCINKAGIWSETGALNKLFALVIVWCKKETYLFIINEVQ